MARTLAARRLADWRRRRGLCIHCGREAEGYSSCKTCRSRLNQLRNWRREHHYCIHCGQSAPNGAQCKRCRQSNRLRLRLQRARTPKEQAILLALLDGSTCAEIGRALGVSRQAVHDFVTKRRGTKKRGRATAKAAAERRRLKRLSAQGLCKSCRAPVGRLKYFCDACGERSRRLRRRQYRKQREAAGFRVERRKRYPRSL